MREVGRFASAPDAVNQTLAALAMLSKHGCAATLATCGTSVSRVALAEALVHPLIVFDIDDTLVYDNSTIVVDVVKLYNRLLDLGARIFLVTARKASMRAETFTELKKVGILPRTPTANGFLELLICPDLSRVSMAAVSKWKATARQRIANVHGAPITLTIGDMWSDMVQITQSSDLDALDTAYGVAHTPWILVRPDDGIACLGLKLQAT